MAHTLEIFLATPPGECFERFCEVERLPQWVPGMRSAEVVWRHPSGLVAEARFRSQVGDQVEEYVLQYSYAPQTLRLVWHPVAPGRYLVRGSAQFEEGKDGTGCLMHYELDLGGEHRDKELIRARMLLNAFRDWMEG